MRHHWAFFKESDSSFGVFYPLHYIVAAFDTIERANAIRVKFLDAGFAEDDVATASGPFVVDKLESPVGASWFERFEAGFASFLGTELGYIEDDHKLAQRGCAFLFVYTPDVASIRRAEALLTRAHPLSARRYDHVGIRRLIYPSQAAL